jgi:hypothetical protein
VKWKSQLPTRRALAKSEALVPWRPSGVVFNPMRSEAPRALFVVPMKEMTQEQAQAEALKRWGPSGAVRLLPASITKSKSGRGRLARYRFIVGNGKLGKACSVQGQGDTWEEAFADARPRP